jgi:hypothetical protein
MSMPSKISTWLMIVFFLLYGLSAFISALAGLAIVNAIVAIAAAVFLFLDK